MERLRHLLLVGLLAGVVAGLVASAIQLATVMPLIAQAEALEGAGHHRAHHGSDSDHGSGEDIRRSAYTLLFNTLAGIGFGLLLAAAYGLREHVTLLTGIAWGAAGFMAFGLAPALGLPPSLPGSDLAELGPRQVWWLGTAIATALGLAGIILSRAAWIKVLGVALVVVPHLIGAPQPAARLDGPASEWSQAFTVWSLVAMAAFWVVLGACSGWLFERLTRQARHPS